jgi:hypothetical protein
VVKAKGLRRSSDGFRNEILLLLCQLQAERHVVEQGHVRIKRMVGKTVNALCPIDSSGGKVFAKDEYCTATSDTLVEIALEGLTTKVQPET